MPAAIVRLIACDHVCLSEALNIHMLCPRRSLMVAGVLWGLDLQIDRQPTMNLWIFVLYHAVPMVLAAGLTSF